jgi:hypothetical protein
VTREDCHNVRVRALRHGLQEGHEQKHRYVTLSPKREPKPLERWGVYDLEWVEKRINPDADPRTIKITHAGMRDESGYRCHRTVSELVNDALDSGGWWFAHSGGLYDIVPIMAHLAMERPELEVKAAFANSSAIVVKVKASDGREARFGDSAGLLKTSVKRLGELVGLQKGDLWGSKAKSWEAERDYNRDDCEIVWIALHKLEERLRVLGGELRATLASCAMCLMRAAFLEESIRTSPSMNGLSRSAYFSSRVEVYRPRTGPMNYYDVNSSFPFSMTQPTAGEILGGGTRWNGSDLAIVEAEVDVPECYVPPLPYRTKTGVFFPTGKWKGFFTGVDLIEAEAQGAEIVQIFSATHFKPWTDLRAYVEKLYEERLQATNELDSLVFKLLMNSLYGKLAENPEKEEIQFYPKKAPKNGMPFVGLPGLWRVPTRSELEHEHVPAAAIITARSRHILGKGIAWCASRGKVGYCDTDSVTTDQKFPDSWVGKELGRWKLEYELLESRNLAPKLYAHHLARKAGKDGALPSGPVYPSGAFEVKVRAKGFRFPTYADFQRLEAGEGIERDQFFRVKSMLGRAKNDGNLVEPVIENITKRFTGMSRPKRAPDGEENTRPWTWEELQG